MKNILIMSLFLISTSLAYGGGVRVGNGGNIVRCQGETSFKSLEYVLTKDLYGRNVKPVKVASLNESLDRILKLISTKLPQYKKSFQNYLTYFMNSQDDQPYVWHAGIIQTLDGDTVVLPYSCQNSLGTVDIVQAVVRTVEKKSNAEISIHFFYDGDQLFQLSHEAPLQMSFLVVHEWIWDLTSDPQKNRRFDYLLHSTYADQLTTQQLQNELHNIGIAP